MVLSTELRLVSTEEEDMDILVIQQDTVVTVVKVVTAVMVGMDNQVLSLVILVYTLAISEVATTVVIQDMQVDIKEVQQSTKDILEKILL